jgi:hypothetical protein
MTPRTIPNDTGMRLGLAGQFIGNAYIQHHQQFAISPVNSHLHTLIITFTGLDPFINGPKTVARYREQILVIV